MESEGRVEVAAASERTNDVTTLDRGAIFWSVLAVAATGGLVGWLTGLSESPVAGVLLPLLFALVAGAGGFHFAQSAGQGRASATVVRSVAQATVLFMFACVVGLHLGIRARLGREADVAAKPVLHTVLSAGTFRSLDTESIVSLAAAERRLLMVGLDADAVRQFGERFLAEHTQEKREHASGPTATDLNGLESALVRVQKAVASVNGRRSPALYRLEHAIPGYLEHLRTLREFAEKSAQSIPGSHYREFLDGVAKAAGEVIDHKRGHEEGTVLTPAPVMDYVPLYGLQLVIAVQTESLGDDDGRRLAVGSSNCESLDDVIRLVKGMDPQPEAPSRRYGVKH
jgi:hypothetical protein